MYLHQIFCFEMSLDFVKFLGLDLYIYSTWNLFKALAIFL